MQESYIQPKSLSVLEPDFEELEKKCKEKTHIGKDEKLKEVIENDLKVLKECGITQKQIYDLFSLFKNAFSSHRNKSEELQIPKFIKEHYETIDTHGWCSWGKTQYKIKLHNKSFDVYVFVFGGAEQCPILSHYDSKYYGYQWGDRDWFFINNETQETFFMGDLLALQILNYCFFQGIESKYRVSPEKIINFFGLKSNVDYSPTFEYYQKYNDSGGCNYSDPPKNSEVILDNEFVTVYENDRYTVVRKGDIYSTDEINVCINGHIVKISNFKTSWLSKELTTRKKYKSCSVDFEIIESIDGCSIM